MQPVSRCHINPHLPQTTRVLTTQSRLSANLIVPGENAARKFVALPNFPFEKCKLQISFIPSQHSGYYMHRNTVVIICTTTQWSLHAPQHSGHYMHNSGHYMHHNTVATICTTTQWSLCAPQHSGHYMRPVTICTTTQWSLYAPQYSGHYMYHNTVVTICTTTQWSLYASQHNGHYMHHNTVVAICTTTQWSLYASQHSGHYMHHKWFPCAPQHRGYYMHHMLQQLKMSQFCPHSLHSAYMHFACVSQYHNLTAISCLNSINRQIFVMETVCVTAR